MRKRQLTYPEAYDTADRIMDLNFCKRIKDKYDQLNSDVSSYVVGLDFYVSTLDLEEEEMIKYVRGERPNPHGKSWTKPLMDLLPILLRESELMNHFSKKVLMKKSWDFEGRNKVMTLPKNDIGYASGSHALAHIECLLTGTEMSEPTIFLCDNSVANLQEV
ncbi:hypothetical protein FXO37_08811 [Capsicum annuum]|nr:hypothetical protein FXO37_08811 [Capsicum annuum]